MARIALLLACAAIAAVAPAPLLAQGAAAATMPATTQASQPADLGEYASLIEVCKLTPKQEAQLAGNVKAMEEALAATRKEGQKRMGELQNQMAEAAKTGDQDRLKQLMAEVDGLRLKVNKLRATFELEVRSILTPEQQAAWENSRVKAFVDGALNGVKLSDDQASAIRPLCEQAVGKLLKLKADDPPDSRQIILQQLLGEIRDKILTESQKKILEKTMPAPRPTAKE